MHFMHLSTLLLFLFFVFVLYKAAFSVTKSTYDYE